MSKKPLSKAFWISLGATGLTAVCCFTPLLVWALALLGLSAYLSWLDYVLLPLLGVLAASTIILYIRRKTA